MCKRLLVLLIFVFVSAMMRLEAQQLNYQAIARNANGVALTFRDVGIRLSIRDGSQTGSIVYSETRNVRTNQFGLFTVVIGSPGASNVLGSMASINWISGNKYLQVEIDPEGGNNYFQAGTSQLQAVPYALFANAAYPVGPAGGDLLGSNYPNPIIAPLAVTTGKIANQAITTSKITDLNVTTAKLADQAITNPKIQDNTIANVKLVNSKVTLNGLVLNLGDAQDFAVGTAGTDVNIISAGKTHTFNFPDASIANRGLITPNAQTIGGNKTFNNNVTAASFIKAGGIAAQFLKADGSVDNNTYLTANQPIIVTATGDATGVSSSSGTAPVLPLTLATVNSAVGTFGNNITVPSITVNNKGLITNVTANPIPTATATSNGLLTVGDWNTFNNKQNAIPLGTSTQYFRGDLTLGNFTTDVRNQLTAGTNITYANGNIGLTNNSVTINALPLALGGSQSFATGSAGTDFNISSSGTVHSFNIPTASATNRGLLSSADFTNFNTAYTSRITGLTTTGSSGVATLSGNVLNIPNYTLAGLGGEPTISTGNSLQYWRGDKTWQTLNTTAVPEGTQQYFTNARARTALSLTNIGTSGLATYDNNTGIINIPNYSASGIGAEPTIATGTTLQYWRGDKSWQTLNTTAVPEGTQQYFTNARARTAISLTTLGNNGAAGYDNTIGVLNIPTYTLTGLGGVPTSRQINGVDLSSDRTFTTTDISEGTNLYFNNTRARSAISLTTVGNNGAAQYSTTTGILNIPEYTIGGLGGVSTARTINGIDLSANQAFSVGTAGTTFNIDKSGTTHLFNIPNAATASVTGGLLSNTDWTTFNNKQSAISGTGYSKWSLNTPSFITQIPLGTDVTGVLPITNGGTGSSTQNFVDLSTNQSIDGIKTFTSTITGNISGNAGTVTNGVYTTSKLNALAVTTSAELAGIISDETGTGALTFANSPTFITPTLGVASATSINKLNISTPATAATLTIADGKTFTANNTITFSGTDGTTMTFPTTTATIARTDASQTFDGTQTFNADILLNSIRIGRGAANNINNTAVGNNSLANASATGARNSAFGAGSLALINDGADNTGIGFGTLAFNVSGFNNTAVGQSALANTTGSSNTAVGQAALQTNTSGINNTAMGKDALFSNLTGQNNTSLGHFSARLLTGNRNSIVGQNSFSNITSGNDNISIGFESGKFYGGISTNNLTQSNNSIFIGSNAGPAFDNPNNQIVIGHNAVGEDDNTVQLGNTSIKKVNTSGSLVAPKFISKNGAVLTTYTASTTNFGGIILSGNDAAGIILITTLLSGTPPLSGDNIVINFGIPYDSPPVVIIQAVDVASPPTITLKFYCLPSATTKDNFTISLNQALDLGRSYQISYHVIGK